MRFRKRKPLPTDLDVLEAIYERYYESFVSREHDDPAQRKPGDIYVDIDIGTIAKTLNINSEIVFGRLYYHLDHKHRYQQKNGSWVHLFTREIREKADAVHFPYLASVLAELRDEHRKYSVATIIASVSLVVSILALVVSAC